MLFDRASNICRRILITAVLLATCQTVYGALPEFPANSIAPLYGTWENAMGKGRTIVVIGSKWIATLEGACSERSRYQVLSMAERTLNSEKSFDIVVRIFAAEQITKQPGKECSTRRQKDAYLDINLIDQGEPSDALITAFSWKTCDTLEHLKQPYDPENPNVESCGVGRGIMDRVRVEHS